MENDYLTDQIEAEGSQKPWSGFICLIFLSVFQISQDLYVSYLISFLTNPGMHYL